MADNKSPLPKRASPPSQGAGIPPPPPEIQRRDVVWLDKGYTPSPRKSILQIFGLGDDDAPAPGEVVEKSTPPPEPPPEPPPGNPIPPPE